MEVDTDAAIYTSDSNTWSSLPSHEYKHEMNPAQMISTTGDIDSLSNNSKVACIHYDQSKHSFFLLVANNKKLYDNNYENLTEKLNFFDLFELDTNQLAQRNIHIVSNNRESTNLKNIFQISPSTNNYDYHQTQQNNVEWLNDKHFALNMLEIINFHRKEYEDELDKIKKEMNELQIEMNVLNYEMFELKQQIKQYKNTIKVSPHTCTFLS